MTWLSFVLNKTLLLAVPLLAFYAALLLFARTAWLQRQVLYAHNVPVSLGDKLDQPETFGFMHRQVTPFRVASGNASLYAWLILPLALYAKHEKRLINDAPPLGLDIRDSVAFKLLTGDPRSRVVVYFHGNAGTLGMPRRVDSYRVISTGCSIITFDYRGFGYSTGSPTESGLIEDAVSIVDWVLNIAHIEPSRIILLGQSLGTAVAAAAAHHFVNREPRVEFAGVILCASFCDAATVFLTYTIGGVLPLLAPLRVLPQLRNWFTALLVDTWDTSTRVEELASKSKRLRLTFIHAANDVLVPCSHTEKLFRHAVSGTERNSGDEAVSTDTVELGLGGSVNEWQSGEKIIRKEIVKYGGHDNIMRWNPVTLAVYRSFDFQG